MVSSTVRPLDHCVLPTASLAMARERLAALGFTVAPDAAHPFGTGNCCVFFADGSYLEPLAVLDGVSVAEAAKAGNLFVARDMRFRKAVGEEGFSAAVLGSADADADHARFVADGVSAGETLAFSRPFVDSTGTEATASFKLAFSAPGLDENCFFFTCQRVNAPKADRSALQQHANRASGISRILMTAVEPARYRDFLAAFSGVEPSVDAAGNSDMPLANAVLSLMIPEATQARYGVACGAGAAGLLLSGIVFSTPALDALEERLSADGVAFSRAAGCIVVPPAAGQGTYFVFEESSI